MNQSFEIEYKEKPGDNNHVFRNKDTIFHSQTAIGEERSRGRHARIKSSDEST